MPKYLKQIDGLLNSLMKVAIHQLHYFPWLGYLHKIAKVDKFIVLDEVQLNDNSYMFRHKLLALNGTAKYISISLQKKGYLEKPYNKILINSSIDWQMNHKNFIKENYRKSNYFNEVWDRIYTIYEKKYDYLWEVTYDSVNLLMDIFEIPTEIVMQSSINYPRNSKKNGLVINLCLSVDADYYYSGNGAKQYMDLESFGENGITVQFQNFILPEYKQLPNNSQFVSGLSSLDMLFNLGIEKCKGKFAELIDG